MRLLRSAPRVRAPLYLAGAVPFILALLFFLERHDAQPVRLRAPGDGVARAGAAVHLEERLAGGIQARLFRVLSPASTQTGVCGD